MTVQESTSLPLAGFWKRVFALIYDLLLVVAILMLAAGVGTLVAELLSPGISSSEQDAVRHHPLFQAWLVLAWYGYYAICWHNGGQTLGMKTWRLKLVSMKGEKLALHQGVLRFFSALGGLGLLYALIHPQRLSLQDILSGSAVLQLPKPAR